MKSTVESTHIPQKLQACVVRPIVDGAVICHFYNQYKETILLLGLIDLSFPQIDNLVLDIRCQEVAHLVCSCSVTHSLLMWVLIRYNPIVAA